jgi:hypothetical protein
VRACVLRRRALGRGQRAVRAPCRACAAAEPGAEAVGSGRLARARRGTRGVPGTRTRTRAGGDADRDTRARADARRAPPGPGPGLVTAAPAVAAAPAVVAWRLPGRRQACPLVALVVVNGITRGDR